MTTATDTALEAERQAAMLFDEGYEMYPQLRLSRGAFVEPGTRVHHSSQHFFGACRFGTATVLGCFEKSPSLWSRTQGRGARDLEFLVQYDHDDVTGEPGRIVRLADYHIAIAHTQKETP